MAIEFEEEIQVPTKIKVIGLGGGGGNAVGRLVDRKLPQVDLIVANTDAQALKGCRVSQKIQLGCKITKGLGSGADPEIGKNAALEDRERIREALEEANIVFIAAGLGGGTGTGAAPVVAQVSRSLGALTIAIVTLPFTFEGRKRALVAETGLKELKPKVDILIAIPNQKLIELVKKEDSIIQAFQPADDILYQGVSSLSDLVSLPGLVNVDFADIHTVMNSKGEALLGFGEAKGKERALNAARLALANPLLEEKSIKRAKGALINITGPKDLTLNEVNEVMSIIHKEADDDAQIIFGAVIDERLEDLLKVTVIATGLEAFESREEKPKRIETIDFEALLSKERSLLAGKNEEYLDIPTFIRKK
ncbi:cell division protein FtsZ [bacterium]|nr:cell division protein FtsZ [bacterium]